MSKAPPAENERRLRLPLRRSGGSDGKPDASGSRAATPDGSPRRGRPSRNFLLVVLALLALNYISVSLLAPGREDAVRVPYSPDFLTQVDRGNVERISARGETIEGRFKSEVRYPPNDREADPTKAFETEVPSFAAQTDALNQRLQRNNVIIDAEPVNGGRSVLLSLLLGFGPVILLVGLFVYFARRTANAAGGGGLNPLGGFGKSRARRVESSEQKITFADVAGIDEAKAELTEIVDFLKNPERYQALGGRIPRGVLLSGRPGTGKTLLARAVAGEADVPFFSISASEFVEAIVGIGASRVRDLFKNAKESSPSIIFIDEMDAIGRSRSSGAGFGSGANDEREQTLNQILTEMDGFESDQAIIVLAATNRPEILDAALLRPGRFDRRVTVPAPDKEGRRKILDVHTRSLPLAEDVSLERLASSTPGMVGADLANLANEAALLAARRRHEQVQQPDFTDALEKIVLGAPRGMVLSDDERRRVAYHEAGHALVGMLTPGADPVRKVSIIPRGMALGVTLSAPDLDRSNYEKRYLEGRIRVALGGRVAEELVFGEITTGAESDIQQLTDIARHMAGRWGMSERIGPIAVLPAEGNGSFMPGAEMASEQTQQLVDQEVHRMVDDAHRSVTGLLSEHRSQLDSLVARLLERETVDEIEAYEAAGVARDAVPHREEAPLEPIAPMETPAGAGAVPAR